MLRSMASADRRLIFELNEDGTLNLGGPWVLGEVKGNSKIGNGTAGTTALLIAQANDSRKALIIYNNGGLPIFLGPNASVTTTTGFPLPPGAFFMDNISIDAWYGVCSGAGVDWRSLEV